MKACASNDMSTFMYASLSGAGSTEVEEFLCTPTCPHMPNPVPSISGWTFSLLLMGSSTVIITLWLVQAFGFYQVFEASNSAQKLCIRKGCCITLLPKSWIQMPRWMPYAKEIFLKGNAHIDITRAQHPTQWFIQTPCQWEIQASDVAFSFFSDNHRCKIMVSRGQLWVYCLKNGRRRGRRVLPQQVLELKE